jgi:hypothetical protein
VLGVSQTPSSTDQPVSGWTRTRYNNAAGTTEVEAYSIANVGHVLPLTGMAALAIHFFGLDTTSGGGGNTVTVASPGAQTGTVGTAASLQIRASDSASGQTLTYSASGLPAGLTINSSTGLISGTPATAGTFNATVTATDTTGASGSASFTWTIGTGSTGGSTCHVSYAKASEWAGGFVANLTISNTGTAAINGWTLTFAFPGDQKVTNAWNATVTQNGTNVTAVSASFDAAIAPGASASMGFQGTWTTNDTAPASFTLNGAPCS